MNGWVKKVMFNKSLKLLGFALYLLISHTVTAQVSSKTSSSWKQTLNSKKGTICVYWNTVKPFVYKNSKNQMAGIEVDLMRGFQEYLYNQHSVTIDIEWVELNNFNTVYDTIKNTQDSGVFGVASFSIIEDRKKDLNFSPAYLKDVSVIVSNNTVFNIDTSTDFINVFKDLQAVSLKNSTYEENLIALKNRFKINFDIKHINSTDEIINLISEEENVFGYLELPNYLSGLNEGLSIKRHNFYPVVREGYAITYPLNSDWKVPMNLYFNSVSFQYRKDQIITKYLGLDVFNLIENIGSQESMNNTNEIGLLTKEKEIQERELNKAALLQQKQEFLRNLLILGILFIVIIASVLFYTNRQKSKINQLLLKQQKQIEIQKESIAQQNVNLSSSNKKLKKLNQQKNDLISILSHDLRAPINQIKGFAEIYKGENKDLSENQIELIDRIILTSDRLTMMIRKIMDVDAVESNKIDIKVERINLSTLLREIATSFEKLASGKKIKIAAEIEVEDMHIEADKTFLTQVFENLVSNAIKFSEPNKTIKVKLRPSDDKAIAMIEDQGPGLTKDDQKKLFKKYQKLSAKPTDGEQSTGLGLSIVKKYVEKMNGKVWAKSTEGQGSTFIVEFDKVA